MNAASHPVRRLDHLVLPTASVAVARQRLAALGFTVAPTGVHPFGTENCCVYFPGGTFIEPLAVADVAATDAAILARNEFIARDRTYRARHGDEGFSALVLGTDDADRDHRKFVDAGISAGNMLTFSRPFTDAAGRTDTATFKLAFAAQADQPDGFFFSCQRVNAPAVDRSALETHANGVKSIARIVVTSDDPAGLVNFLVALTGSQPTPCVGGFDLEIPDTALSFREIETIFTEFSVVSNAGSVISFAAIVYSVPDLAPLKQILAASGVAFATSGDRIIVPPAPGQGVPFLFEVAP